jgi:Delta6-protoilludene synthase
MVTIVMHQFNTDIQGAMDYIGDLHDGLAADFLLNKDRLPSWGEPVDSQVAQYVDGLGNWVRANDQWSFESQRYFGMEGLDILKHRVVKLLPKVNGMVRTARP